MTCAEVQANLSLYLYGELDFAAEEAVEVHLDHCPLCQLALGREKEWHAAVNKQERDVRPEWLAQCRGELHQRISGEFAGLPLLESAKGTAARHQSGKGLRIGLGGALDTVPVLREFLERIKGFWQDFLDFRVNARSYRLAAVSGLILLGFTVGRMTRLPGLTWASKVPFETAGLLQPEVTRVQEVRPEAGNRVRIILQQVQVREVFGNRDDNGVRALLVDAAKGSSDPGVRMDSVEMLAGQGGTDIRNAIVNTIKNDANAAVRVKAIQSLGKLPSDLVTRGALEYALAYDHDPGVRAVALDVLVPSQGDFQVTPQLMQIISEAMHSAESDDYVRLRCEQILKGERALSDGIY